MAKSRKEQVLDALKSKLLPSFKIVVEEDGKYHLLGEDEPITEEQVEELELDYFVIILTIRKDEYGR